MSTQALPKISADQLRQEIKNEYTKSRCRARCRPMCWTTMAQSFTETT